MSENSPEFEAIKWRERERFAVKMANTYLAKIEELIAENAHLKHKLSKTIQDALGGDDAA